LESLVATFEGSVGNVGLSTRRISAPPTKETFLLRTNPLWWDKPAAKWFLVSERWHIRPLGSVECWPLWVTNPSIEKLDTKEIFIYWWHCKDR
jgi:hypothetical protein